MWSKESRKRIRSANYTNEDTMRILELVTERKAVVENKTNDAISCREKELAWEEIAQEYNSGNRMPRTSLQLKSRYDTIKKEYRSMLKDKIPLQNLYTYTPCYITFKEQLFRKIGEIINSTNAGTSISLSPSSLNNASSDMVGDFDQTQSPAPELQGTVVPDVVSEEQHNNSPAVTLGNTDMDYEELNSDTSAYEEPSSAVLPRPVVTVVRSQKCPNLEAKQKAPDSRTYHRACMEEACALRRCPHDRCELSMWERELVAEEFRGRQSRAAEIHAEEVKLVRLKQECVRLEIRIKRARLLRLCDVAANGSDNDEI